MSNGFAEVRRHNPFRQHVILRIVAESCCRDGFFKGQGAGQRRTTVRRAALVILKAFLTNTFVSVIMSVVDMSTKTSSRRPLFVKCALEVLNDHGCEMSSRHVMHEVKRRLRPTSHESVRLERSGMIRWQKSLQFDSVRLVKAGWLRKGRGIWYLTKQGQKHVQLEVKQLYEALDDGYRQWESQQLKGLSPPIDDEGVDEENAITRSTAAFEQAVDLAHTAIQEHIHAMDAYEFQDLVAALLRSMGYHTPFVAPPGRDGGIDILAYRDPFGTVEPRIKVQVKHRREAKVSAKEVREMASLLNKKGDTGLFVSTAGFTADAYGEVRHSPMHIETLDLDRLMDLWETYYDKLAEEDKAMLPLRKIAFLAPPQD
ncbi:MAG: restriction endonuclease [Phycisphaerales bacterium]|nr:restriction endonuclease [Phycisphaerales bacterium]